MDAGLALVNIQGLCYGYLPQEELELALDVQNHADALTASDEFDIRHGMLANLIDRSPVTIAVGAPVEYAIEMFGKLGLRYLVVVEAESAHVVGVIIKKRLLSYMDAIKDA
jgi:chloride channel 3/4/5